MRNEKKFSISSRKKILPQMFDVRPVNKAGELDVEKIKKIKKTVKISREALARRQKLQKQEKNNTIFNEELERFKKTLLAERTISDQNRIKREKENRKIESARNNFFKKFKSWLTKSYIKIGYFWQKRTFLKYDSLKEKILLKKRLLKKSFFSLVAMSAIGLVILFIFNFTDKSLEIKKNGMIETQKALAEITEGKNNIKKGNFKKSYTQFEDAHQQLAEITKEINNLGDTMVNLTKYVPYLSKISSGKHLVTAGDNISQAGVVATKLVESINEVKTNKEPISYLGLLQRNENNLKKIANFLQTACDNLEEVNLADIPKKNRSQFITTKQNLSQANSAVATFLSEEHILVDILGGNGPRKYLFLFQNNQEMRATGGFIGSYGLLDIFNGKVRQFFIDGIYNPDNQLKIKVVPPIPIQKISVAWSLHDCNWWPDFPTSAEKAIWFYEKTGGPTVDGVIAMTPTVMQKLLKITGPIEMPNYGLTVDENNFVQVIQEQVEVNYDKTLNHPKRVLADLAPKILNRLFNNNNNLDKLTQIADALLESLNEKQILIYSRNWDLEKIISQNNWSGEVLTTPKDYISVINTNINGFKTDGVIDENIYHRSQIEPDGTIVDTLIITRKHNGGDSPYVWWNKVNADYMRVYVPKGSRLISAE
ncbi:MAG TPA: DUF4012 domain-containing protein, partial [Candidatus Portnoybacteria bacterium]|nr:DUF4012 domain-containing protein [Candidatus Portnoybacteria bacterium]